MILIFHFMALCVTLSSEHWSTEVAVVKSACSASLAVSSANVAVTVLYVVRMCDVYLAYLEQWTKNVALRRSCVSQKDYLMMLCLPL